MFLSRVSLTCFSTYRKPRFVGEVQFTLHGVKGHARFLGHGLDVHCLVGLETDHKLITMALAMEDIPWHIPELDSDFCFPFVQSLNKVVIFTGLSNYIVKYTHQQGEHYYADFETTSEVLFSVMQNFT